MDEMKIEILLENRMQKYSIPGASVILVNKEYSSIINKGIKNINYQESFISDETLFSIGSVTKVFTALLACDFIQKNQFKLDTPISEILKDYNINESLKNISIFHLLTHTSGLEKLPFNFQENVKDPDNPYKFYQEPQLKLFLETGYPIKPVNKFFYSNLGYGLLGYLIEKCSNESLKTLFESRIFIPLKMTSTTIYDENFESINNSTGYKVNNFVSPLWDMGILKGAGAILSSPEDLKKYLQVLINQKSFLNTLIHKSLEPLTKKMAWGWLKHGFFLKLIGGKNNYWHNGMTGGFSTYIEINIKKEMGFVLLLNKAIMPDYIGFEIANAIKCIQ